MTSAPSRSLSLPKAGCRRCLPSRRPRLPRAGLSERCQSRHNTESSQCRCLPIPSRHLFLSESLTHSPFWFPFFSGQHCLRVFCVRISPFPILEKSWRSYLAVVAGFGFQVFTPNTFCFFAIFYGCLIGSSSVRLRSTLSYLFFLCVVFGRAIVCGGATGVHLFRLLGYFFF
jgi:hypothetical protein